MTEYSLLRKIADDLRSAADTIENGLTRYQGKLIPVLPDDVNVGDVIRPDNEMWMRVTASATVARRAIDKPVTRSDLLTIHGTMLKSPYGEDYPSSHDVYANEWVVVER